MSVNEKNTKKQILDAYQSSLAEIKKLKANQLDPKAEKAKARSKELKELTHTDKVDDTLEELLTLSSQVPDYIRSTVEQIHDHSKKVNELREEIELQEQTLQDLYGIENEAETMAALVETKRKVKVDLDESIGMVKRDWDEERSEREKRYAAEEQDAEEAHRRRITEWEYDFNRLTKTRKDELQDSLAATKKSFQEEMDGRLKAFGEQREELEKREAVMDEINQKLDDLEKELERYKENREQELATTESKAKAKAAASYHIEVNALKKGHEAEVTVLTGKNEALMEQVIGLREETATLAAKLNEAYAKIQDVALKSLESQGNARMVEMSRSMASDQRPSKN